METFLTFLFSFFSYFQTVKFKTDGSELILFPKYIIAWHKENPKHNFLEYCKIQNLVKQSFAWPYIIIPNACPLLSNSIVTDN